MKTTVNLREVDIPLLKQASIKTGLSRSDIIERCLKMLHVNEKRLRESLINNLVEYQPRGVGYRITHVGFSVERYNFNVNFRVFSRCSVSLLVTLAIKLFLDDVVNNRDVVILSDNYFRFGHVLRHNPDKNDEKWEIVWEIGIHKRT